MNKYKHGNCWDFVKELEDNSVDAIITDPPYGKISLKWDLELDIPLFWKEFGRVIKPSGAIVMTANQPFSSRLVVSNLDWFKYEWIWDKQNGLGFLDAKFRPLATHENIIVFSRGGCSNGSLIPLQYNPQGVIKKETLKKQGGGYVGLNSNPQKDYYMQTGTNYPKSIIKIAKEGASNSLHPTQKPVALFEYLIRTYTNEGDTVLDPFGGSGTTAVACIRTKRNFITYEQDAGYFETMKKRIELEQTKITLF